MNNLTQKLLDLIKLNYEMSTNQQKQIDNLSKIVDIQQKEIKKIVKVVEKLVTIK